jgi:hypothetical protein
MAGRQRTMVQCGCYTDEAAVRVVWTNRDWSMVLEVTTRLGAVASARSAVRERFGGMVHVNQSRLVGGDGER